MEARSGPGNGGLRLVEPTPRREYWNVDLNKEVTHLLTSLSRGILPILHLVQDKFTHCSIFPPSHCELVLNKVKEDKITHYSLAQT